MGFSLQFYTSTNSVFQISLFLLTLVRFTSSIQPLCHNDERAALLKFKEGFIINKSCSSHPSAYPKFASWQAEEENGDCCTWDGIKCSEDTGHVIKLDLTSSYLCGSINSNSSLFRLVRLEWLSLADNGFDESNIPSELKQLSRLSHLDLSYSGISGQIPVELLELRKLETLNLSFNYDLKLQKPGLGSLAKKLTNLRMLDLGGVKITSRLSVLTNLSSLTYLSLQDCELQGSLPSSIGNLTKLVQLDLSSCQFSGELPTSLGALGSLTKLDLQYASFLGQLPSSLSNLTQLSYLDLSGIDLVGDIPSWILNLTQLNHLHLCCNQLTGSIPHWLFNLKQLSSVVLFANQLTGHIPFEIEKLTHLRSLQSSLNQLQGPIPNSIFDLKNLEILDFYSNNLNGTLELDTLLHQLKSLKVLLLSLNNLSLVAKTTINTDSRKFRVIGFGSCNLGSVPQFLHNQNQLEWLDLSSNKIAGQIPGWLLNVSTGSMKFLNLSYNFFTGFDQQLVLLPWTGLVTLDLTSNKLQGQLPIPPKSTNYYLVSNNMVGGKFPSQICSLNDLVALDLSNNNFSGKLPQCLGNFSLYLKILDLRRNKFHGSIPQTFINGGNLMMIDFSHNLLQGMVPRALVNCTRLRFLNLGNNQIRDIFPSWLGTLPDLEILVLQSNKFYGEIREPKTDVEFPNLRIIDLSHNRFTGKIPSKFFNCWNAMKVVDYASELEYMDSELLPTESHGFDSTYYGFYDYSLTMSNKGLELEYQRISTMLTAIILSNNRFMGEIPTSIGSLKGLRNLNLANNNFQGCLPSSLGNLSVLETLDLSKNKLSGEIPQQLAEITTLEVLDISFNNLTGPIPQGNQFNTFENSSFEGNPGLCGKPLSKKCEHFEASQKDQGGVGSFFVFGWKVVLIGYVSGLTIGVLIGNIFTTRKHEWCAKAFRNCLRRKWKCRNRM